MSYRPRALRLPLPLPCRALAARLAVVEAAVTPNHGSSLRDAVDRVESTVNRIGVTSVDEPDRLPSIWGRVWGDAALAALSAARRSM